MAVSTKPGASANAQTVYNALRAKGYSNAAAAGAVGNLQQESSVNPGSKQPGGAGRGIAQWGTGPGSGGRWEVENAYAKAHKQDPWALNTQIGFLEQEMTQRGLTPTSAYGKSTNVTSATSTFETVIEQAGAVVMGQRIGYANNAYAAFSGNKVTATTPATGKGYSAIPGIHAAPASAKKASVKTVAKAPAGTQPSLWDRVSPATALTGAQAIAGDIGGAIGSGAQAVGGAASSAAGDVTSIPKAVGKVTTTLFSVSFWIRVAFIIVGVALVFIGTKALLTGSPPQMPGTNNNPPTPAKAAPVQHKSSFGKNVRHGADHVAEVTA
jgi:hypothetical protein